ncbi:hypothetical protein Ddye_029567 [Dipteronia dyeriana]|uniref:Zinc finger PMZ-type domain-containing protein n=1 Tax=Dipteronia dyeriana TaxID=168575 RepID=A0AAD9TEP7_9ROSI|nr:hypothetical protein Ddye_029567 [Dipteronia dyeriana]
MFGTDVVDVGQCDCDHINLITLIHATIEELSGKEEVPNKDFLVWIHLPWRRERVEAEMLNYDGDSEKDDDKDGEDGEGEDRQSNKAQHRQYNKIKTLVDIHECHKIYNNKEAKANWIASKFKNLVMGNPSICVKGISDILREKYNVSVVIRRLYKAKKRALEGYCARHIYVNFRLTYKGDRFKKLFWRASRSFNVFNFKETMDEIGAINPVAKSWLQEIEPKHWSWVLTIIVVGNMEYDLLAPNERYDVKLGEYSWQCGSWQVGGIPYRHALVAISHHCGKAAVKDNVSEYVHRSLTMSAYMQTYRGLVHLIPDKSGG